MKTIFDYNPTNRELVELFGFDEVSNSMAYGFCVLLLPVERYDDVNPDDAKLLDLAKLFEHRGMKKEAAAIWSKIPDIERQYKGGFDYEQLKK
ncbi:MAG: hypothetical protein EOO20_22170 [Chryseobacterium sp.]|nr:MAG: hypothetical protein EOO20_22170 [Chryseobacterium sp.]